MSNDTEPWFVAERSEAFAGVLLTSRKDVRVRSERKYDHGPDFLVELDPDDPIPTELFVVQVLGTQSSDPNDANLKTQRYFLGSNSAMNLPVCLFVVNIRENQAWYAWVAEPRVEAKGPTLRFPSSGTFRPLNAETVGVIIDQVREWYEALRGQLAPA